MSAVPTGWPRGLAPPGTAEFEAAVVGWLLDRCPPEFRGHEVLRRHPRALARLTVRQCEATLEGMRAAYAAARRELGEALGPETLAEVMAALESEGARAAATLREARLVEDAVAGTRWTPRL